MNVKDVMYKFGMTIDDVLNVRAIYGGTVSIVPDELMDEFSEEMYRQSVDSAQSKSTGRCKVRFKSIDDSGYNRAMMLFLMLPAEELRTIL